MIIAIDVTYTPSGGSATQITNIIKYLDAFCEGAKIIVYTKRNNLHLFNSISNDDAQVYISNLSGIGVLGRVFWGQAVLPLLVKKHHVDVLFCPGNIAPIFSPVKTIQWIGTIGPFWEEFYTLNVSFYRKMRFRVNKIFMYLSARKSEVVIYESEYSKALFINNYGVNKASARVLHIGKDEFFYPEKTNAEEFHVNGMVVKKPYILCVSHLYEYKNVIRLIEAFSLAKNEMQKGVNLVIAGEVVSESYYEEIRCAVRKFGCVSDVIFLGLVSKEHLRTLYSTCEVMVFPCPVENFAYTLVEAMCCGAPLISSNTTAMPETCGDAALYFDPNDSHELAVLLINLIKDNRLQMHLRDKALERVKELPDYEEVNKIIASLIAAMAK